LSALLAAALCFVLCSAAASLLLLLPVVVAAESLPATGRLPRRFWLLANLLPPAAGLLLTILAFAFLGGNIAANPHHAELRTRPHLCLLAFTATPDAPFRYRLYALIAVGLLLFALVRLLWGLHSSLRAQRLADRLTDAPGRSSLPRLLRVPGDEADGFSLGLWRPVTVVTEGLIAALSPDELAAVLAHEQAHIAHRDIPVQLLLRAAGDALIWLPTTHYYLHMARGALERRADEVAAARTSPEALAAALRTLGEIKQARQLQGDLAALRPAFPDYAHPRARLAALAGEAYISLALPLPVILGVEAALLVAAIAWLAEPLHDTLYCAARSLLDVLTP
jgi:Zn-dependent protease with chaperone function